MERRNFLIGMGSTAAGASALIGSGAFSRIESQRQVTIEVAEDANAYLGMEALDTPNGNNYVDTDDNGHLYVDISDSGEGGQGVNSDSFTYFDGLFELCNQGKADADISYALPETASHPDIDDDWMAPDENYDYQVVTFYYIDDQGDRVFIDEDGEFDLPLGECKQIGIRTVTKGVDATAGEALIDGEIVITADAPDAGDTSS